MRFILCFLAFIINFLIWKGTLGQKSTQTTPYFTKQSPLIYSDKGPIYFLVGILFLISEKTIAIIKYFKTFHFKLLPLHKNHHLMLWLKLNTIHPQFMHVTVLQVRKLFEIIFIFIYFSFQILLTDF